MNTSYKELFDKVEETSKEEYFETTLRKNIVTYEGLINYIGRELEEDNLKVNKNDSLNRNGKIVMVQSNTSVALANIIPFVREKLGENLDSLPDVLDRKNHDYGNSFDQLVDLYGDVAMSIRVSDKMSRLRSLLIEHKDSQVDESINDTLLDLVGYMLLTLHYEITE